MDPIVYITSGRAILRAPRIHIVNEGERLKKGVSAVFFFSVFVFFSFWLKDKREKELNNSQTFAGAR